MSGSRWHYDNLIRDGVDLTRSTQPDHAVWGALLATAMSYNGRGRSDIDWLYALDDPESELGHQSWVKRKVKGKPKRRTPKERRDYLGNIWDKGVARTNASPPGRLTAEIEARASAAMDVVADADLTISDVRRSVLAELANRTRAQGMLRVSFSRASVCEATGLNPKAVRLALEWLSERGLVVCISRGTGGGSEPTGDAAKYQLPEAEVQRAVALTLGTCPVNGTSRPLASTSRPLRAVVGAGFGGCRPAGGRQSVGSTRESRRRGQAASERGGVMSGDARVIPLRPCPVIEPQIIELVIQFRSGAELESVLVGLLDEMKRSTG